MLSSKSGTPTSPNSLAFLEGVRGGLKPWLMAFRPKTLSAAVAPVAVATALVPALGYQIRWDLSLLALFGAIFIQIGTNLVNDAIDFKKGADREDRLGPVRVTQSGLLSSRAVMSMGFAAFFLAFLCGIPIVIAGGWPLVIIGVLSLVFGYAYTGGPVPLAYVGLGDFFVILFFGLIAVGATFYLHVGVLAPQAVIAGLQVGALATVLIAINNLRDIEQDRRARKRTLAVRLGRTFARAEIAALLLVAYGLCAYWWFEGFGLAALLPLWTLPLAARLISGVWRSEPGAIYNSFLARAAAIQILFGLLFTAGLVFRG